LFRRLITLGTGLLELRRVARRRRDLAVLVILLKVREVVRPKWRVRLESNFQFVLE
jgi:hypothetical protein